MATDWIDPDAESVWFRTYTQSLSEAHKGEFRLGLTISSPVTRMVEVRSPVEGAILYGDGVASEFLENLDGDSEELGTESGYDRYQIDRTDDEAVYLWLADGVAVSSPSEDEIRSMVEAAQSTESITDRSDDVGWLVDPIGGDASSVKVGVNDTIEGTSGGSYRYTREGSDVEVLSRLLVDQSFDNVTDEKLISRVFPGMEEIESEVIREDERIEVRAQLPLDELFYEVGPVGDSEIRRSGSASGSYGTIEYEGNTTHQTVTVEEFDEVDEFYVARFESSYAPFHLGDATPIIRDGEILTLDPDNRNVTVTGTQDFALYYNSTVSENETHLATEISMGE